MRNRKSVIILFLLVVCVIGFCVYPKKVDLPDPINIKVYVTTPIQKIIDNPKDYQGSTISIEGTVTKTFKLFGYSRYTLTDETGSITVVGQDILPTTGDKIKVVGHIDQWWSIGSFSKIVFRPDQED